MPQFWHDAEHQVKSVAEMAHKAQLYLDMNINQTVTQTTALSAIASAVLTISTFTLMLTLSSNISIACEHRPRRLTTNDEMENDHDPSQSHHEDEQQRMGVQFFNSPSIIFPQTPYELQYPALTHEGNFTCGHCRSILWKEERSNRYSCCQSGKQAIHPLLPVPSHIQYIFDTPTFQDAQRSCNGLFSFTALGAGGIDRRTWTQPAPPSMLTLHGKAYH